MNFKHILPAALVALAMLTGCGNQKKAETPVGIDLANLDTTAVVGEDFYQYACGGWIKSHPLTAEYSSFGVFNVLNEKNRERLNELFESLASQQNAPGSVAQKIGDLYTLALDSAKLNAEGIAPIQERMKQIAGIKDKAEILPLTAELYRDGISCYFFSYVGADIKNSKMNLFQLYQGGINLGEKEYYLDNDSVTTNIRDKYKQHIVNVFRLAGFDDATARQKMEAVMEIETSIAKVSLSATEQRDPAANYHKMNSRKNLQAWIGIFIWKRWVPRG